MRKKSGKKTSSLMEDRTSIAVSIATRKDFLKLANSEDLRGPNTDETMKRFLKKYRELKEKTGGLE